MKYQRRLTIEVAEAQNGGFPSPGTEATPECNRSIDMSLMSRGVVSCTCWLMRNSLNNVDIDENEADFFGLYFVCALVAAVE